MIQSEEGFEPMPSWIMSNAKCFGQKPSEQLDRKLFMTKLNCKDLHQNHFVNFFCQFNYKLWLNGSTCKVWMKANNILNTLFTCSVQEYILGAYSSESEVTAKSVIWLRRF